LTFLTGCNIKDRTESGEPAMQLTVPPDIETLINKRLSSGAYASAEDVLRRALEAQDAGEAGPTRSAVRYRLISRKAIDRPSAASGSTAQRPAEKSRR
jgi:Arc/MetJ-type ribon-helix-helix transcriptional regulator